MRTLVGLILLAAMIGGGTGASPMLAQVPSTGEAPVPRFKPVDVYIDSNQHPLAAYQFELTTTAGDVQIVGIEGGDHPAYREAPFYDPAALSRQRVIIAAYSTAADLPTGKTWVARVHLRIAGAVQPKFEVKVIVAASVDGKEIPAEGWVMEGEGQ